MKNAEQLNLIELPHQRKVYIMLMYYNGNVNGVLNCRTNFKKVYEFLHEMNYGILKAGIWQKLPSYVHCNNMLKSAGGVGILFTKKSLNNTRQNELLIMRSALL